MVPPNPPEGRASGPAPSEGPLLEPRQAPGTGASLPVTLTRPLSAPPPPRALTSPNKGAFFLAPASPHFRQTCACFLSAGSHPGRPPQAPPYPGDKPRIVSADLINDKAAPSHPEPRAPGRRPPSRLKSPLCKGRPPPATEQEAYVGRRERQACVAGPPPLRSTR